MLERDDILQSISSNLNNFPDVAEKWRIKDPTVTAMLTSIVEIAVYINRDNDINTIEPFIKSRNRTIIADAINKGILPVATPCQFKLIVENRADATVTLSQNRLLEDGTGRQWRTMAAVTLAAGTSKEVLVEQSTVQRITGTIPVSDPFYTQQIKTTNDAYFSAIGITNKTKNKTYQYTPKFMNAADGDLVYTLNSDDLETINITYGATGRAGTTVQAGEVHEINVTQTYGSVDPASLAQAALSEIYTVDETKLNLYFKQGGLVRSGTNPLTIQQLRLLASFPSMYDQNAVFMGNYTFLVMSRFISRFKYMAIWNETIQEKYYGADLRNINKLNLAVSPRNVAERAVLIEDIKQLVSKADSLLAGNVRVFDVVERPYKITITGRLAAVHDIDSVKMDIKELLLLGYGKGSLAATHYNADGFNIQEISTRLRSEVTAFQDRISDFSIMGEDLTSKPIKPHEWAYLSDSSITINLTRTADSGDAVWTM